MNLPTAVDIGQLVISAVTLLGVAFAAGRILERQRTLHEDVEEMRSALFGSDGKNGVFVRRSEQEIKDREFHRRLTAVEAKR